MATCLAVNPAPSLRIVSALDFPNNGLQDEFVRRNGSQLFLGSARFFSVGPNAYWLGLDEEIARPKYAFPRQQQVLEVMATVRAMGGNTIRSTTLGVSVGNPLSIAPRLGVVNEEAFAAIDFALFAARRYGVRFIIPLVDQYDYYHGGIRSFLRFRNLPADSPSDHGPFYNLSSPVHADFLSYITTLLTHKSPYTGLSMAEDPTVLAFETGNELGGTKLAHSPPPLEWTTAIANLLKSLAPNTLVMSGSYGVVAAELAIESVDIHTTHFYPPYSSVLRDSANLARDKVFMVGEFDWTDNYYLPLSYLLVLVPVILAAGVFLLPARWWPWRCGCFGRRTEGEGGLSSGGEKDRSLRGEYSSLDSASSAYPPSPIVSPPSPVVYPPIPRRRFEIEIRRWQFALFLLLFAPIFAGIIFLYLPTPLHTFLVDMEKLVAEGKLHGSFYWSLFGRDDACCRYIEHGDGFTLHYPTGEGAGMSEAVSGRIVDLIRHAYVLSGANSSWAGEKGIGRLSVGMLPSVVCPQLPLSTGLTPG